MTSHANFGICLGTWPMASMVMLDRHVDCVYQSSDQLIGTLAHTWCRLLYDSTVLLNFFESLNMYSLCRLLAELPLEWFSYRSARIAIAGLISGEMPSYSAGRFLESESSGSFLSTISGSAAMLHITLSELGAPKEPRTSHGSIARCSIPGLFRDCGSVTDLFSATSLLAGSSATSLRWRSR